MNKILGEQWVVGRQEAIWIEDQKVVLRFKWLTIQGERLKRVGRDKMKKRSKLLDMRM